jgi:oligopeptide transport system ATP-binding protein
LSGVGWAKIDMGNTILEARDVKKYFPITKGLIISRVIAHVKAVDGVSFTVDEGDVFGIVGESGCGKTTTLKMLLLLESITSGHIFFDNKDISRLSGGELKYYRRSVQAMFQDPYSSLDPTMKIGNIIAEPMEASLKLSKQEVKERVSKMLAEVKLPPASAELFPHEFSGGQRQRIALARAIGIRPRLVILDEPVSALDVSVRAQLMNLLMDIQQKLGLTYIIIAHDLAVVRHMSNRMAVMYLGKIVEYGDSERIYIRRLHPYTKALLSAALPSSLDTVDKEIILPGEVPSPINPPSGCHFHPRCVYAKDICRQTEPQLEDAETNHSVACHFWKAIS